jgi:hypothetical protein
MELEFCLGIVACSVEGPPFCPGESPFCERELLEWVDELS